MMRFLRRFRRASGEYFSLGGGVGIRRSDRHAGAKKTSFSSAMLFSWKIFLYALSASAHGPDEGNFREIILVQTGNVLLMRAGYCLLRLDNLYCVGNACTEAILRLCQASDRPNRCCCAQPSLAPRKTADSRARYAHPPRSVPVSFPAARGSVRAVHRPAECHHVRCCP